MRFSGLAMLVAIAMPLSSAAADTMPPNAASAQAVSILVPAGTAVPVHVVAVTATLRRGAVRRCQPPPGGSPPSVWHPFASGLKRSRTNERYSHSD